MRTNVAGLLAILLLSATVSAAAEKVTEWKQDDARFLMNVAEDCDPAKPTKLIIYLCPNGSTIEMTLGCKIEPGMDWHYDIQHIAAQTRLLRKTDPATNYVLVVGEAQSKSYKLTWPVWRKDHGAESGKIIRKIVADIVAKCPAKDAKVTLAAHSGGGSFIFGYLNGGDAIGDEIERISWLDANYAYNNEEDHHGDKLLAWLKGDPKRHLIVLAYNDRAATLNGKPFVSETGGTFYRSHKMVEFFNDAGGGTAAKLDRKDHAPFEEYNGMNRQIHFMLHTNPEARILHTVLVERNGLIEVITWDTAMHDKWGGEFWGKRAYMDLVDPAPAALRAQAATRAATTKPIPSREAKAMSGKLVAETIADLPPKARESAIREQFLKGNFPDFLRKFVEIRVKEGGHEIVYQVMPDYLAVGDDADFVRMPMTPNTAKEIAEAFQCSLPTRKMVNDIYAQAAVKIEPRPMTEQREAVRTFVQHNAIIQEQLVGKTPGQLVGGDKKDIVITTRLKEKPGKVAIYGWHKLDGKPIQPLYLGHGDFYVDYSHGVRLVKNACVVDGKPMTMSAVMKDPELSKLVSDEGPVDGGY